MPDPNAPQLLGNDPFGFSGYRGPGYTPEEYQQALGTLSGQLGGIALPLGLSAIGGPEMMSAKSLLPALMQAFIPSHPDPSVQQSVIPTKKNIPAFVAAMRELMRGRPNTPANMAEAYMMTRYPGRMKLPATIYQKSFGAPGTTDAASGEPVFGEYDPGTGALWHVKPETLPAEWQKELQQHHPDMAHQAVDTLGHETQHAVHARRALNSESEQYLKDLLKDKTRPYLEQWQETGEKGLQGMGAAKAGRIAEKGYRNFWTLLQDYLK